MERPKTAQETAVRRHLLGLIGLALVTVGLYFTAYPPAGASSEFLQGSCTKSGLVLLAIWLAFPHLDRLPGWLVTTTTLTLMVIAARPQILFSLVRIGTILAPLLGVLWLLRPKTWNRGRRCGAATTTTPRGRASVPQGPRSQRESSSREQGR